MNKTLSLLTFNLYFGQALNELIELTKKHRPDIVCVQEFPVNETTVKKLEDFGYELADYSTSFFKHFRFYSVATFYNPKTIKHRNGQAITLGRSFYEILLFFLRFSPQSRTSLSNNFVTNDGAHQFRICNIHLTALQSTNAIRTKQLQTTLDFLKKDQSQKPTIVVGDFNYVYKRKNLEKIFQDQGFKEATNNLFYTIEARILGFVKIKMKPDYIWYQFLSKPKTKRLPRKTSDHYPILTKLSF